MFIIDESTTINNYKAKRTVYTVLRKLLYEMDDTAAMEWMFDKLKDYKTNAEFFESMKRK